VVVALGLVSVPPDYSGRAVVGSVVWDRGLIWRVSCLVASGAASGGSVGRFGSFLGCSCCLLSGWRVGVLGSGRCWSVVLLPLVCAPGVLSGLHSPPFLLSVSGLGVPLVGASGLGVWSVWSVWCGYILHLPQR